MQRRPRDERWSRAELQAIKSTPWQWVPKEEESAAEREVIVAGGSAPADAAYTQADIDDIREILGRPVAEHLCPLLQMRGPD